jgi:uncharacterized membrane protein
VLVAGLSLSAAVIAIGLILCVIQRDAFLLLPAVADATATTIDGGGYGEIWDGLRHGTANGFLNLGMLLLVATPVLRVVGSLCDFVRMRDWRFAGVTLLVLLFLAVGVLSGI